MSDLRKKLYADGKFYYPLRCKEENNSLLARLPGGFSSCLEEEIKGVFGVARFAREFRGDLDISSLFFSVLPCSRVEG
jgi:hypothetical protein